MRTPEKNDAGGSQSATSRDPARWALVAPSRGQLYTKSHCFVHTS